jgi:hypothetical protein
MDLLVPITSWLGRYVDTSHQRKTHLLNGIFEAHTINGVLVNTGEFLVPRRFPTPDHDDIEMWVPDAQIMEEIM